MGRLEGKVALILGASSEGGTGWRTAELFAREGARVAVAARSEAGVKRLAQQIGGHHFLCDAAEESSVARLVDAVADTVGPIDCALNAAGQPVPSDFQTLDRESLLQTMTTNLFGHMFFFKHVARRMSSAGGSITSIASLAATAVIPGNAVYGIAKAGVVAAVRYAAAEYAPRNIRINAISPGIIDTPMVASLTGNPPVFKTFIKETPLGRIIKPEEVAKTALWLAADAETVTGISIITDGGMHLRRPPYMDDLPSDAYDRLT